MKTKNEKKKLFTETLFLFPLCLSIPRCWATSETEKLFSYGNVYTVYTIHGLYRCRNCVYRLKWNLLYKIRIDSALFRSPNEHSTSNWISFTFFAFLSLFTIFICTESMWVKAFTRNFKYICIYIQARMTSFPHYKINKCLRFHTNIHLISFQYCLWRICTSVGRNFNDRYACIGIFFIKCVCITRMCYSSVCFFCFHLHVIAQFIHLDNILNFACFGSIVHIQTIWADKRIKSIGYRNNNNSSNRKELNWFSTSSMFQ